MSLYLIVALTMLNHIAHKGGKLLIALYAMEFGATPLTIGTLFSLNSLCSLFFAIFAGRFSDRFGPRVPMIMGSLGLTGGLLLPYLFPHLGTLYVTVVLSGTCYVFFQLSAQQLIGASGSRHQRTNSFGMYSVGTGVTALVSPIATGFSIDQFGHHTTFLLLALAPVVSLGIMLAYANGTRPSGPRARRGQHRTFDLVRNAPLRRVLITAGIIEAAGELYTFFMPIYGHSLKLSASLIGLIIGAYAAATLLSRFVMPALVRKSSEEIVLIASLAFAALVCALFPFAANVYLLAAISFMLGLGLGCCNPLSMITVYNRSPAGRTGEALGLRYSVTKFSEVVVPLVFGTLGTSFGVGPLFLANAVLLGTGAFVMRKEARTAPPRP